MTVTLGVDPGGSGAAALYCRGQPPAVIEFAKHDESAILQWFVDAVAESEPRLAVLERVGPSPKMGAANAFTFGESYGFLRAALMVTGVRLKLVVPRAWQAAMQCMSGGDKNVTKRAAQVLFPNLKITHGTADALLIAVYAQRLIR